MIECLESRMLFSSGPILTGVHLNGAPDAVTSVVLSFNEPLDSTTAQNAAAYALGKPPAPADQGSSFDYASIFGWRYPNQHEAAGHKPKLVKNGKIQMASVVYDSTADTVTLTPLAPFKAHQYFKYLRVSGAGPNAIKDMAGDALNSGANTIAQWKVQSGRTIHYHDPQHNHITLKLTGPGKLMVFTLNKKEPNSIIFVEGGTSATTLSGMITNNKVILPQATIQEISGTAGITDNMVNNPMFNVIATSP